LALSSRYLLRESASNLRRNFFMTLAAILTMAVSLTAGGAVLIVRQAIHQASVQSQGGVELAIFMDPQATPQQIKAIQSELDTTPGVQKFTYLDKPAAYNEFKTLFAGNNDIIGVLSVAQMPTSFRVVPTNDQDIDRLGNIFSDQPGVLKVSYPAEAIQSLLTQARELSTAGIVLLIVVSLGGVALIVNTIQLAIFARRREVAVMKLVGATNWFIRIPFMLEGAIHGIVGAILSGVVVYLVRNPIAHILSYETIFGTHLTISPGQALADGAILLAGGAVVGILGSAFAVARYLSV
jgi:cell division transport system permease protein